MHYFSDSNFSFGSLAVSKLNLIRDTCYLNFLQLESKLQTLLNGAVATRENAFTIGHIHTPG
jgi:hypothetical protein